MKTMPNEVTSRRGESDLSTVANGVLARSVTVSGERIRELLVEADGLTGPCCQRLPEPAMICDCAALTLLLRRYESSITI